MVLRRVHLSLHEVADDVLDRQVTLLNVLRHAARHADRHVRHRCQRPTLAGQNHNAETAHRAQIPPLESTFRDPPLVLMPINTSPGRPRVSTCRANTPSKWTSLVNAVRKEVSVVSAIAAIPGRTKSMVSRLTNSAAMC